MGSGFMFLAPAECDHPYTISEINEGIASLVESGNTLVWVEGEISNWRPASSGHVYFRLKDAGSQIPAVIWHSSAVKLGFTPSDGDAVLAIASLRVYRRGGYYQLDVHKMQLLGEGRLFADFQKLKSKLEREGLFDSSWKKPLPQSVERIGVITSKTGAAIHDIVRVAASRAPQTDIVLFNVMVQGDSAAPSIVAALRDCNTYGNVDCIILGRGGGSIEDLQPFNEECVARAIFDSKIPVISAVGHEIDFTIADFVADVRAPTPSAAAQIALGDTGESLRLFSMLTERFRIASGSRFAAASQRVELCKGHRTFRAPLRLYRESQQRLDDLQSRFLRASRDIMTERASRFASASRQLASLGPFRILGRGYSVVTGKDGAVVKNGRDISAGEKVHIRFSSGEAWATIDRVQPD